MERMEPHSFMSMSSGSGAIDDQSVIVSRYPDTPDRRFGLAVTVTVAQARLYLTRADAERVAGEIAAILATADAAESAREAA